MADATIDKVQIEIEAKASKANDVLDQLARNLGNVKRALTGFDTSALERIQKSLDSIESKAQAVSKTNVTPNIDTSKISTSERKISNSLENIQDKFARLSNLANAAMGGDTSALTSFKRQATSLQGDLDVLQGKLQRLGETRPLSQAWQDTIRQEKEVEDRLSDLKAKMNDVMSGKTTMSGNAFQKLQEDIKSAEQARERISETQRLLKASGQQYSGSDPFQTYRDGALRTQKSLDGLIDKVNAVKEAKPTIDTSKIVSSIKSATSSVVNLTKKLLSIGGSAIKGAIKGISKAFDGLKNGVAKVKDGFGGLHKFMDKGFMKILKYGFGVRSIYVGFRRLRKAVVESFGELQKSGAFYETTRANIESLKNSLILLKYQFGAAFEPIFNAVAPALQTFIDYVLKAMNAFSAFTAKLMGKNSYSKAVLATQAVEDNVGGAAKAAKELNKQLQGFDELNNLTTSNRASGSGGTSNDEDSSGVTYVSESVDNALGDFGKELANHIKNGDWGAVGEAISSKLTAQLKDLNSKWPEIFEKAGDFGTKLAKFFKGLITPDLFSEIGTTVGSALKTALTATFNFAKTMSEVNEETGRTGWEQLGDSIAAGINGFVSTHPLELVVDNFNEWALGILSTLGAAIKGIDWDQIGDDIATAISKIKAEDIGWELGDLANSLANAFYKLVSRRDTWAELGKKIGDGINGFFKGMSKVDEDTGLTGWQALGQDITETIVGIATAITTALETVNWEEVGQGIADFIANIDWSKIVWALGKLAEAFKEAFKGLLKGLGIDMSDVSIALTGVVLAIAAISGIKFAASITGAVITKMISNAIVGLISGGGAAATAGASATAGAAAGGGILVSIGSVLANIAGVTIGVAAAATIGYKFGNTFGQFIAQVFKNNGIISDEANDEYYTIATEMSFIQKVKDIKLAAETDNLKKGWDAMWDDWFEPLFSEGRQIVINVKNFALTVADKAKTVKEAWTDFWGGVGEKLYDKNQELKINLSNFALTVKDKAISAKNAWINFWGSVGDKMFDVNKQIKVNLSSFALTVADKAKTVKTAWSDFWGGVGDKLYEKNKELKINVSKFALSVAGKAKSLKDAWNDFWGDLGDTAYDKVVSIKAKFDETKESLKTKVTNVAKQIKDATVSVTASLKDKITDKVSKIKEKLSNFKKNFKELKPKVNLQGNIEEKTKGISNYMQRIKQTMTWIKSNATMKLTAEFSDKFSTPIKNAWNNLYNRMKRAFHNGKLSYLAAKGGSFYSGSWHDIPQYANGTTNALKHGTMFVAGEAGPEIVGHINGRTEILNRSQLASTMYTAITRGMMQFRNAQMVTPQMLGFAGNIADGIATGISSTNNDSLLMEQNRLLAEQNRWLQQIANKDVTISSKDVYNATMREARNYNNKTGNSPFLF